MLYLLGLVGKMVNAPHCVPPRFNCWNLICHELGTLCGLIFFLQVSGR